MNILGVDVLDVVVTLVIVVFYLGPVASAFRWVRSKTRKTDSQ
jgi:uncharacterized membrane protein